MAVPVGTLAFAVLAIREIDQSFVDTYSTAVSVQNLRPRWDRRALALIVGSLATVFALTFSVDDYEKFLILIGSVFVPLFAVASADFLFVSHQHWDVSPSSRLRWAPVVSWVGGFVAYQLIYPGTISWWNDLWHGDEFGNGVLHRSWTSASVLSFVVAGALALLVGRVDRAGTVPADAAARSPRG